MSDAREENAFLDEKATSFPNLDAHRQHMTSQHGISICSLCDTVCKGKTGLRGHRRNACKKWETGKNWKCIECEQRFGRVEDLGNHMWEGRKCQVVCSEVDCWDIFHDKKAMAWHLRYKHPPQEEPWGWHIESVTNDNDWQDLGAARRAAVKELTGDEDFPKIRRAERTSLFLYDRNEELTGYLTYRTHSSEPGTHVVFIELYGTAGKNKFELAQLAQEAERLADAKSVAELYVRPNAHNRELFVALQYRVADYSLLPTSTVLWPTLGDHRVQPVILKRTNRWKTTRIPQISLPEYETRELTGETLRLHKRLEWLKDKYPDIEDLLAWWTEERLVAALKERNSRAKTLAKKKGVPKVDPSEKDQCITPDCLWTYANGKTQSSDATNWDVCPLKPGFDPTKDFDCFRDRYPAVLNRMNPPWSLGRAAAPKAVLEMLRGSSTIMLVPHSSVHNLFGRTILAAVAYKHTMGPVCYEPHNRPNPTDSWMAFVMTPQYLQYVQDWHSGRRQDDKQGQKQ